jgi:hypothetical protein
MTSSVGSRFDDECDSAVVPDAAPVRDSGPGTVGTAPSLRERVPNREAGQSPGPGSSCGCLPPTAARSTATWRAVFRKEGMCREAELYPDGWKDFSCGFAAGRVCVAVDGPPGPRTELMPDRRSGRSRKQTDGAQSWIPRAREGSILPTPEYRGERRRRFHERQSRILVSVHEAGRLALHRERRDVRSAAGGPKSRLHGPQLPWSRSVARLGERRRLGVISRRRDALASG